MNRQAKGQDPEAAPFVCVTGAAWGQEAQGSVRNHCVALPQKSHPGLESSRARGRLQRESPDKCHVTKKSDASTQMTSKFGPGKSEHPKCAIALGVEATPKVQIAFRFCK